MRFIHTVHGHIHRFAGIPRSPLHIALRWMTFPIVSLMVLSSYLPSKGIVQQIIGALMLIIMTGSLVIGCVQSRRFYHCQKRDLAFEIQHNLLEAEEYILEFDDIEPPNPFQMGYPATITQEPNVKCCIQRFRITRDSIT